MQQKIKNKKRISLTLENSRELKKKKKKGKENNVNHAEGTNGGNFSCSSSF